MKASVLIERQDAVFLDQPSFSIFSFKKVGINFGMFIYPWTT